MILSRYPLSRLRIPAIAVICILLVEGNATGQSLRLTFDGVIGREGSGIGQLMHPAAVAIDPVGNLYVVDTGNIRIQQFNVNGKYIRHVGGSGVSTQQFNMPVGLDASGLDVYVTDVHTRRIHRFDRQLNSIGTLSGEADENAAFGFPRGIAISGIGDIYITDIENEEVVKMNTSGQIEIRFGGFSYGKGRLCMPAGIAVNNSGAVFVADTGNDRIAVFDAFGGFLHDITTGSLKAPEGVDVNELGRVYVADTGQDRVVIFSSAGDSLLAFGARGSGLGSFREPTDIAVARDGKIYVVDTGNHRIQKFVVRSVKNDREMGR